MEIRDINDNRVNFSGCFGCNIVSGNIEPFGGILYKSNNFIVAQDFELPIPGFIVISSIKHYIYLSSLSSSEQIELMNLINKIINLLKEYGVSDEYNIVLEEKEGYHFHVWLMPRSEWMKNKFGKILKNIKGIQEYAINNMKTDEVRLEILSICNKLRKDLNMSSNV